jgi:proline iminopeptidase
MKTIISVFLILTICIISYSQEDQKVVEGFLKSNDTVNLYYQKLGKGPEAVLVPAGMYLAKAFKQLLKEDRTIIFYDPRGRGRSDDINIKSNLGFRKEIADLESVREHFNFKKVSLIGWSYLGAVVALYAGEYPDNINRVIQINPIPPRKDFYWDQYIETRSSRLDSADVSMIKKIHDEYQLSDKTKKYIKEFYKIAHKAHFYKEVIEDRFREDFYNLTNERPDNVWKFILPTIIESFGNWDFRKKINNIQKPFLIIQGDFDAIPKTSAFEWNENLLESRLLVFQNVGHFPWLEDGDMFFSAIDCFLSGEWPKQSIDFKTRCK